MKSKIVVEVLREQVEKSLFLLTQYFSNETDTVKYYLSENDQLFDKKEDGTQFPVYGLMIELDALVEGKVKNKKLWYRRYRITGSLNDIKAQAFSELCDVVMGTFLVTATRADNDVVEKLSKEK